VLALALVLILTRLKVSLAVHNTAYCIFGIKFVRNRNHGSGRNMSVGDRVQEVK
jgi:hypothetical protein